MVIAEYEGWEKQFGKDSLIVILYHHERKTYVARAPSLGLTAYGDTKDEAVDKLQRMFIGLLRTWSNTPYKGQ